MKKYTTYYNLHPFFSSIHMKNLFAFAILVILMTVFPIENGHAEPLTLEDAVVVALGKNPQAVEARESVAAAEARTGQTLSSYYPQLSVGADWNKGRTFMTATESIKPIEVTTSALYLKQTIYDFGRTAGTVASARSNTKAATEMLTITRQDLAFRVRAAFYSLLAAEKQVRAVRETVSARDALYHQAQEFFNQGVRAKIDVANAEANLYAARTLLTQAENNRDNARVELANAMGITSLEDRTLVESETISAALPELSKAQQKAIANRAELKRLAAIKDSAAANLKTAKSGYLPILSGIVSIGYADKTAPPDGEVWAVGLNLTVPIFSGFSTVEQEKEAVALMRVVEAQETDVRLQIVKETEFAWRGMKEASSRIASTEKEMAAARENRILAEGRYHEGVGNIIEITDAQSQALNGETAHIQAIYDYHIASARFNRAVGKE